VRKIKDKYPQNTVGKNMILLNYCEIESTRAKPRDIHTSMNHADVINAEFMLRG